MSGLPSEPYSPQAPAPDLPMVLPVARPIPPQAAFSPPAPDPMLLGEVGRWGCLLDLAVFIVGFVVFQVVFVIIAGLLWGEGDGGDIRALNLGSVFAGAVFTLVTAAVITRLRGLPLASLGISRTNLGKDLLLGFATAFGTFPVFWMGILGLYVLWPAGYKELLDNPENIQDMLPRMSVGTLAGLAVVVGVYEEVAFRGFLLTRLRRLTGRWWAAVVLSSAVFTALHLGMQRSAVLVPLLPIAVLWCLVTIWRRSLVPAIVAHFLFDLIMFLVLTAMSPEWQ